MKCVLTTFVSCLIAIVPIAFANVGEDTRFNSHCLEQIKKEIPGAFEACTILGYDANEAFVRNVSDIDAVKVFLDSGIDINVTDQGGYFTALTRAAYIGRTETVKFLLKQEGLNVNFAPRGGSTALIRASLSGHLEVVKLLLSMPSIRVNVRDESGDTALSAAKRNGYTGIVDMLRRSGAVE